MLKDTPRLKDASTTARLLGISPGTLAKWRCAGIDSPPYLKLGRKVLYDMNEVDRWLEGRRRTSTSQAA